MKRTLILRQRHFLVLLSTLLAGGLRNLLSFFLTLAFFLCLLLALQSERIDKVARWLEAPPTARARMLETWLAKSDIVQRVSIASIDADHDAHKLLVSDASFRLASGIEARFHSLVFLPRSLHVQGLKIVVPTKERRRATTETTAEKRQKVLSQKFWHKLVQQVEFFSSLLPKQTLTLEDSVILIEDNENISKNILLGQPLLRLRFDKIEANNRNGLTWRGRGTAEVGRAESRRPVVLTGNYATASKRLFQSLRIENFSPQEMLHLIARTEENKSFDAFKAQKSTTQKSTTQVSKATRLWLEGKGQLSIDYRFDLRENQSWFRMRFARNTTLDKLDKKATLSFNRSIDIRRTGLSNTVIAFRALPLGIVRHASDLFPARLPFKTLPFRLTGLASGSLSLRQQQQTPNRFLGHLSLEQPRFRWNENLESAAAHRLTLAIEGNDESLQIAASLALDDTKESGLDKNITILPHGESTAHKKWDPSKFRLTLEGSSRGAVPVKTVRALWPPRFKPRTRKTVDEVVKAGEMTDITVELDAVIDLKAKTRRLTKLDGKFLWQKGRLQLFAKPVTLTDIEADASFTKKKIVFEIKRALYGDFRIKDGEVSFERKTLANDEKHTLMRLALSGEGAAESMRRFALDAPFLQDLEYLQRSARWLPPAPRTTAKGHFNMISFIDQLDDEASEEVSETIFPHPLSYDTAWQAEDIRLQAPFLRFYEGAATLVSSSVVPLDLTVRLTSDRGATLKGSWLVVLPSAQPVRQRQETQRLTLKGSLDAKALASDFPYIPQGWIQEDLPTSLTYSERADASDQGLLNVDFSRSRLRVESLQPVGDKAVRLFGSIDPREVKTQTQPAAWQIEGTFRTQGKKSLLFERERGQQKEKPLSLLLENLPKPAGVSKSSGEKASAQRMPAQRTPAEWRLSLEGDELDLSGWLEQKPWISFVEEKEISDENKPSLGWGKLVNLTVDARLKRLQLQKNALDTAPSRANDLLGKVRASLRWQDGKIHDASFFSHSPLFSRSEERQRRQAQRRVKMQAFYTLREGKELFSAYIEDIGSFLHQVMDKNFADGGRAHISFVRSHLERQRPKPHFEGYATVRNVSLYNLPLLLKIFDAVDFISAFSKGIKGLDVRSDLRLWDGILTLKEFSLANNLTALSANGSLDLRERKLDLRGEIASLHLISKILRNIPLIGAIVVGRKEHNLFAFSYEAKGEWGNPKVTASPLNILLPGILKIANPLQLLERDDIKKAQDKKREQIAEERKKNPNNTPSCDTPSCDTSS